MDTVYVAPASAPCRLVLWLLNITNQKVKIVILNLLRKEHQQEWFKKISSKCCVPTYVSGNLVITESQAISKYIIASNKNNLLTKTFPGIWNIFLLNEKISIEEMLQYDIGTFNKRIGNFIYPVLFKGERPDKNKLDLVQKSFDYLNQCLEKRDFLCSDRLTLADISIAFTATMLDFFEDTEFAIKKGKKYLIWEKMIHNLPDWEITNEAFNQWIQEKSFFIQ